MTSTRIYLSIAFLFCSLTGFGQYNDFGTWSGITLEKAVAKNLNGSLKGQLRFNENDSELASSFLEAKFKYRISKHFRLDFTYRFGNRRDVNEHYFLKHRYSLDLVAKEKIGEVDFSYRLRYQSGVSNLEQSEPIADYSNTIRNKLSAKTKLFKKTVGWASGELFTSKNSENSFEITDWRLKFGVERKIKKRQFLDLGFMVQRELSSSDPVTEYVILLGYTFELKGKVFKKKKEDKPAEPAQ